MTMLSPQGLHVGSPLDPGIIIAYGHYTDDEQAVLVLVTFSGPYNPPSIADWPDGDSPTGNYCTFMRDENDKRTDVRYWWNIHDASLYMQEYMGQDR